MVIAALTFGARFRNTELSFLFLWLNHVASQTTKFSCFERNVESEVRGAPLLTFEFFSICRVAQQSVIKVDRLLFRGHPEVVDADLADYFGGIPHTELLVGSASDC